MKYRFLPAVLLYLFSQIVYAETIEIEPSGQCSYYGEDLPGSAQIYTPDPDAENIIDKIVMYSGLRRNFTISASPSVYAATAATTKGVRHLLYNQAFMDNIKQNTHTYWSEISIMAHEIGHHLQGHTLDNTGSRPKRELEADEYSGFILHKMGASLEDAQTAMNTIPDTYSSTHPDKQIRLQAIRSGWMRSYKLHDFLQKTTSAPPTLPKTEETSYQHSYQLSRKQAPVLDQIPSNTAISGYSSEDNRYKINDSVVNDAKTGLMWTRCSFGQQWDGSSCRGQAAKYKWEQLIAMRFEYGRYADWRVPTIYELRTLLSGDYTKQSLGSVFPSTAYEGLFWSSSYNESDSSAWAVNLADGREQHGYRGDYFAAMLVRNSR